MLLATDASTIAVTTSAGDMGGVNISITVPFIFEIIMLLELEAYEELTTEDAIRPAQQKVINGKFNTSPLSAPIERLKIVKNKPVVTSGLIIVCKYVDLSLLNSLRNSVQKISLKYLKSGFTA